MWYRVDIVRRPNSDQLEYHRPIAAIIEIESDPEI